MSGKNQKKVLVPPINLIFKYLQQQATVTVWLFEQVDFRIEGKIRGFDEFMNIVIDQAFEVSQKDGTRTELGKILLKGDNITQISSLDV